MKFKKSIAGIVGILLTYTTVCSAPLRQVKVGVVDTGLNLKDSRFKDHLCASGHENFTSGESIDDVNGHGTHVAGLIRDYAGNSDYCLVILKYYSEKDDDWVNSRHELAALKKAVDDKVDIVNFSGGGPHQYKEETSIIKNHPEIVFVVAAGNGGSDLDIPKNRYYPAALFLENIVPVGSLTAEGERAPTSNYGGVVTEWEIGENVLSDLPDGLTGYKSGTSMATAIHTGKMVKEMSNTRIYLRRTLNGSTSRF